MENWQLALIILASVLMGAMIPVIVMFALLLASVRRQIESTGRRVDEALDGMQVAVDRVNRVTSGIDGLERPIGDLVEMLESVTQSLGKAGAAISVATAAGAAVAPTVATFVKTMMDEGEEGDGAGAEGGDDDSQEAGAEDG